MNELEESITISKKLLSVEATKMLDACNDRDARMMMYDIITKLDRLQAHLRPNPSPSQTQHQPQHMLV